MWLGRRQIGQCRNDMVGGVAEFFLATAQHAERRSWVKISLRPIHPAEALPYSDRRTRTLRYPASPKLVCEREFDLRVGSVGAVGPQCPFTSRMLPRMR